MGSAITGDHDVAVEISERVLTALAERALLGGHVFAGRGGVRISAVRVEAVTPGPAVRLTLTIAHGKGTIPGGPTIHGIRGVAVVHAPVRAEVQGTDLRLTVDTRAAEVRELQWDPAAKAAILAQIGRPELWALVEQQAPGYLQGELRREVAPFSHVVPAKLKIPGANTEVTLRAVELKTEPRSGASPGLAVAVGTFVAGHTGAVARRSRAALGAAHDVALTLSPEALRDGVLCPALAAYFGTTAEGLCPACGNGSVSLKEKWNIGFLDRLTLDRIDVTFEDGRVRLDCRVSGEHALGDIAAHLTLHATFAIVQTAQGTALRPTLTLAPPAIDIDTNDVLDFFTGFATQAAADAAEGVLAALAMAEFAGRVGGLDLDVVIPTVPDLPVTWDVVVVGPDGGTLHGRVALGAVAGGTAPFALALEDETTRTRVAVGSGAGGATCLGRGYPYTEFDDTLVIALRLEAVELVGPVTTRWSVSGAAVPAEGGTLTLAASNDGRGADANDEQVVVVAGIDATGGTLTLRNRPSDGNYGLYVQCVVEDAIDRYTVVRSVSVDGQPREWDDDRYLRDRLECAKRLVPIERRFPWPASDGPEYGGGLPARPGIRVPGLPGRGPVPGVIGAPEVPGGVGPWVGGGFVRVGARVMQPALVQLIERQLVVGDHPGAAVPADTRPARFVVARELASHDRVSADGARVIREVVAGARKVRGVFAGVFAKVK